MEEQQFMGPDCSAKDATREKHHPVRPVDTSSREAAGEVKLKVENASSLPNTSPNNVASEAIAVARVGGIINAITQLEQPTSDGASSAPALGGPDAPCTTQCAESDAPTTGGPARERNAPLPSGIDSKKAAALLMLNLRNAAPEEEAEAMPAKHLSNADHEESHTSSAYVPENASIALQSSEGASATLPLDKVVFASANQPTCTASTEFHVRETAETSSGASARPKAVHQAETLRCAGSDAPRGAQEQQSAHGAKLHTSSSVEQEQIRRDTTMDHSSWRKHQSNTFLVALAKGTGAGSSSEGDSLEASAIFEATKDANASGLPRTAGVASTSLPKAADTAAESPFSHKHIPGTAILPNSGWEASQGAVGFEGTRPSQLDFTAAGVDDLNESKATGYSAVPSAAVAPLRGACACDCEKDPLSGDEDEAEKEFRALSPVRRYLVSQQQKEQRAQREQGEVSHEQQLNQQLQQEQQQIPRTFTWSPVLEEHLPRKGGQLFLKDSVAVLSEDANQGCDTEELVLARPASTSDVFTLSAAAVDDVLPAFANEENRRLYAEIQKKREGLMRNDAEIAERGERTHILAEHLKHVLLELQQTSRIAAAKTESIKTEEHMAALRQRYASQLQRHAKNLAAKIETYAEQLLSLNAEKAAGSARLDQFKLQMNWNAAELKQWSVAEQQKQQDRLQVERLQRADEREVKKLTLLVEKLCSSTHVLKGQLHQQTMQARGLQMELDSAGLRFNKLQQDRLHVIEQWEAVLESTQQRDEAIQHAAARYSIAQEEIQQKLVHFHSMKRFTNEQVAANEELKRHLQQLEKASGKLREALATIKGHLDVVNENGEELRNQLSAACSAAAKTRRQIEHLQQLLERRKQQHVSLKRRGALSQRRIEDELRKASSKDEAFKKVEAFCKQLDQDIKALEKKLKRSRQLLFEEEQQHAAQQAACQVTQAELSSSKAAVCNLLTQLHRLDQERQRQQELLYAVDFQSQVMQRRVARVAGHRGTAEKKHLTAKIEKFTQFFEQQKQQLQMLTTQLRRLEGELRKAQREEQFRQKEVSTLTHVLEDLRLECESLRRETTERQKEKEFLYVEHDTLRLEVKKLQDQLRTSNAAACAAEAEKQQVQVHIEEEIAKAENRLELVRTAARVAYEERHKLLLELATRKAKILNLESKYSVLVQKMKTDDGEKGVDRSLTYYIIKASQEKQDLQRVGDELDQKIRDAEQESRSLELTLQQLRQRNRNYQKSLEAEKQSVKSERESRKELEAQLVELHDTIYEQQQLARKMRKERGEEERQLNETLQHLTALSQKLEDARGTLKNLGREVAGQWEKLCRAEKQHRELRRTARAKHLLSERKSTTFAAGRCNEEETSFCYDPTTQSNVEMEPHLHGLKGHMHAMLHSLSVVLREGCTSLPAAVVGVEEALAARGLKLPSRPVSVHSSSDGQSGCGSNNRSSNG